MTAPHRFSSLTNEALIPELPADPKRGKAGWIPSEDTLTAISAAAAVGCTDKQIGELLKIDLAKLSKNKAAYQKFNKAVSEGRSTGIFKVATAVFKKACEGDMTAAKFWLTRAAKWAAPANEAEKPAESGARIIIFSPETMTQQGWYQMVQAQQKKAEADRAIVHESPDWMKDLVTLPATGPPEPGEGPPLLEVVRDVDQP